MGRHDDLIAKADLVATNRSAYARMPVSTLILRLAAALAAETARADREVALADRLAEVVARRGPDTAALDAYRAARAVPSGSGEQETDRG
jgi:hypothetical protein